MAWCTQAAAPFTARVLARSRRWIENEPEVLAALAAAGPEPLAAATALRWTAGLHHLALRGLQPWAALWPPGPAAALEGAALDARLDAAIAQAWAHHRPALIAALSLPPQTNEVQRSAALLPGLLWIAAQTGGLPLRLFEIGSSAGLNLWCERWRYETDGWSWGDIKAPLTLRPGWTGAAPPVAMPLSIARRAGCDRDPVDLAQPGEALRLASFVWAEQAERLARLRCASVAATRWAAAEGVAVQAMRAIDFVRAEIAQQQPGQATVLMHSVVWQYIPADEQAAIEAELQAAGARASADRPLAWLRFEPPRPDVRMELRCRLWTGHPGGPNQDHLLARCHPHGASVDWLAGGDSAAPIQAASGGDSRA